jgi:hypothetical protein
MKLSRIVLALVVLASLTGLAYVAQKAEAPGVKMVLAAQKFLDSLSADQKGRTTFAFDSKERTNWYFVPKQDKQRKATRKGLALEDMKPEQKKLALGLLAAGTSKHGHKEAVTIMSLEAILRDLEKNGTNVRDPEWYFFTIFGTPSKTGKWGWRVEGHHLSLNFTMDGTQVVASTPAFFGANPATVKAGERKGLRTLASAEDLPKQLLKALEPEQRKIAEQKEKFREIEQANIAPTVGNPVGLPAAKMNDSQKAILMKLLLSYTERMPEEVGDLEMKQVRAAGLDKVHFAYTGGTEPGQPHTYRVQGPTFVIEFLNVQGDSAGNPANHIHSAWRRIKGDFGL